MSPQEPILIYQMGKVGSSSIVEALSKRGLSAIHIHALNPRTLATIKNRYQERDLGVPLHIQTSQWVWAELIEKGKVLRIITLVREPIARNISAYFENLHLFRDLHGESSCSGFVQKLRKFSKMSTWCMKPLPELKKDLGDAGLGDLTSEFVKKYPHRMPLRWFNTQIKEVLGLDVYEYPFPKAVGSQRIRSRGIDLLILRAETPDKIKVDAMQEFLGISQITLVTKNVTAKKRYKKHYSAFLEQVRLPGDYVDEMYESQYAKHFYTPEEIRIFRERWTRGNIGNMGLE